ncbi:MAG: LPXTG cell wall anchor domain-containing protein [Geodermatophilaceae bacterium]|nr:LPXTG cell wall anchor domain-containing protein [Geodermatophilaceae bacterium]
MSRLLTSAARRFCAVAGFTAALTLTLPIGSAAADAVDDAIEVLQSDSLYVDPGAGSPLDEDRVRDAIGDLPLLVAVLPDDSGDAFDSATRIGLALPGATVAVVADQDIRAGSDIVCAGFADDAAGAAVDDNVGQLQADGDVTALLLDFAAAMEDAPGLDECGQDGGGSGWIWFAGIGVVGLVGIGGYVVYRRRKQAAAFEGLRAEIMSHYNRLAADVSNLDPGEDPITRQAVADAAERYTSTGALLDEADTTGEYAAARRTVLEGLYAARTARQRLGLDTGSEIPPVEEPVGEQLTESRQVTVGEETHEGFPHYTPDAPHYYRGGRGVPGGWYRSRFWEGALLGSVLSGRTGGGFGYRDDRPGAAAPRWRSRGSRSGGGDWGRSSGGGDWGGAGRRSGGRRNSWGGGRRKGGGGGNRW